MPHFTRPARSEIAKQPLEDVVRWTALRMSREASNVTRTRSNEWTRTGQATGCLLQSPMPNPWWENKGAANGLDHLRLDRKR